MLVNGLYQAANQSSFADDLRVMLLLISALSTCVGICSSIRVQWFWAGISPFGIMCCFSASGTPSYSPKMSFFVFLLPSIESLPCSFYLTTACNLTSMIQWRGRLQSRSHSRTNQKCKDLLSLKEKNWQLRASTQLHLGR